MTSTKVRTFLLIAILSCLVAGSAALVSAGADEVAKPTLDPSIYRHVVQVGWVVKDLDSVVNYWEMLGLKNISRTGEVENPTVIYHGKKDPAKMKMAFGDIGGVQIEWIQPLGGDNAYTEFLKRHGDGVHHLAYQVPSPESWEEQIRLFKQRGIGVVQSGSWKGAKGEGRFAYLDTAPKGGGITIELMYNPDWPAGGETPRENEEPLNKLVQYALIVHNVKKVGEFWQQAGFGGLKIDHNVSLNRVYRGQPGNFEMYLGWGRAGDLPFEWIESLKGPNVYEEVMKERGEGFHHVGFNVADMDAAIEHFKAKGVTVSESGGWDSNGNKGRFAYLDTDPHGGVTIELLWNAPRNN